MVDSHCHLNLPTYNSYREQVLQRFRQAGGKYIMDIATDITELNKSLKLQTDYPELIMTAAGIHPEFLVPRTDFYNQKLAQDMTGYLTNWQEIISNNSEHIKAIGETGIDLYYVSQLNLAETEEAINQQTLLFQAHLVLAMERDQPLIIHSREKTRDPADTEALDIIIRELTNANFKQPVIFHSFVYGSEQLTKLEEFNFFLGCNGIITYSNVEHIKEAVKQVSIEKLLLETDGPWLTPANIHHSERLAKKLNEPQFVRGVATVVAKLKEMQPQEVINNTTNNFQKLFGLASN